MAWIAFTIGVILGAFAGILAVGLCQMAATRDHDETDENRENLCPPIKSPHPVK